MTGAKGANEVDTETNGDGTGGKDGPQAFGKDVWDWWNMVSVSEWHKGGKRADRSSTRASSSSRSFQPRIRTIIKMGQDGSPPLRRSWRLATRIPRMGYEKSCGMPSGPGTPVVFLYSAISPRLFIPQQSRILDDTPSNLGDESALVETIMLIGHRTPNRSSSVPSIHRRSGDMSRYLEGKKDI